MHTAVFSYTVNGQANTAVAHDIFDLANAVIEQLHAKVKRVRYHANGIVEYVLSNSNQETVLCVGCS